MKILINNEIKTLEITNPETGCNWEQDLIGNANGFDGYDDEKELYIMTQDTYDWWDNYIKTEQDLQNRASELKNTLDNDDAEKFEQELIDASDNDMEMMQASQKEIIETWEAK